VTVKVFDVGFVEIDLSHGSGNVTESEDAELLTPVYEGLYFF
jgi:hypothetical protein